MPFCSNCGKELSGDIKFCPECGTSVGAYRSGSTKREYSYEGKLHKCPHCGEMVKSFLTNCPLCGYEFRNSEGSTSVKKLVEMLDEIEKERSNEPFSMKKALVSHTLISNVDERKITLIKNYPIPNTKEDIYEFLILAASNLNMQRYNKVSPIPVTDQAISDAWEAKFKQAYEKAKILFGNTPDFENVRELYHDKIRTMERTKKVSACQNVFAWIMLFVLLFSMLFLLYKWIPPVSNQYVEPDSIWDRIKDMFTW